MYLVRGSMWMLLTPLHSSLNFTFHPSVLMSKHKGIYMSERNWKATVVFPRGFKSSSHTKATHHYVTIALQYGAPQEGPLTWL